MKTKPDCLELFLERLGVKLKDILRELPVGSSTFYHIRNGTRSVSHKAIAGTVKALNKIARQYQIGQTLTLQQLVGGLASVPEIRDAAVHYLNCAMFNRPIAVFEENDLFCPRSTLLYNPGQQYGLGFGGKFRGLSQCKEMFTGFHDALSFKEHIESEFALCDDGGASGVVSMFFTPIMTHTKFRRAPTFTHMAALRFDVGVDGVSRMMSWYEAERLGFYVKSGENLRE